jgi:polyhydroxyalkanoate synthesis regulator phasin
MENLKFDNDAIVDPKDAEIEGLKKQVQKLSDDIVREASRADMQAEQLDRFGDAIMGVIGDKVEALADSVASREIERALDDYEIEIWDHQDAIGEMIDERLPEGLDDESRADDLKAAVREILADANVKLELE